MSLESIFFINTNRIKGGITEKDFEIDHWMFCKKSFKIGIRSFESWADLSSSRESDFLSTTVSGCESIKSLLKKAIRQVIPSPFVMMPNLKT